MRSLGRAFGLFLFAALAFCAVGCSQNPSYFPYLLPTGDVVRPHAKPIWYGYYANFDPHAVDLAVEPQQMTSQVGSQVVILSTVRDAKTNPRRNRRIDWMVTGGNIVEVDESGCLNGRGGVEGNRAWSFTAHQEQRLSRGNPNKLDDIMIRPGQSWLVVSSPTEGDTHVQVVVPGIHDWDKRMKTVVVRWVDATWEFPPAAVARFNTEHEFVTRLARFTDRQPLAKYRVRYRILDGGPPAVLLPSQTTEAVVISDLAGLAKVRIKQTTPASGVNRVAIDVIRPPDPTTPGGSGVTIVSGETSVDWIAPDVKLSHTGPGAAPLGADIVYTTSAKNEGRIDSQSIEFRLPIPDGLEFIGSNPPAPPENGQLVFTFPGLAIGQAHTVQTTFRGRRAGAVKSVVLMRTGEGQSDQREVDTMITTPQLKAELIGPQSSVIDAPIRFAIRLSNPGTGPLDEILLTAEFDKGLEFENPAVQFLQTKAKGLAAGESRDETLVLTPRKLGPLGVRVTAASGNLKAFDQRVVVIQQPKISLKVDGPAKRFVGRPAEWKIIVKNESDGEQAGVVIRDRLPPELRFIGGTRNPSSSGGEVTWNLGAMKPGEEIVLDLTTECIKAAPAAVKTTTLSALGTGSTDQVRQIAIEGIAALKMEMAGLTNPVAVGKTVVYRITLTNTGSAPAKNINVKGTASNLLKPLRAVGPTKETVIGDSVTFGTVDAIQAGAKVVFEVECEALKEGDARFQAQYTSDLNVEPLIEQEPTRIGGLSSPVPAPPGGAPPPPPPPQGGVPMPLPPG